ncbi:nucleoside triphosphate pyrophosphohydrolase [Dinoroseobacter sp. S124A]|uniref:nucleoside triphosphate pyrophosphohydrolase n=1 Tax=Dinoroseobacter sp. S124A TaxID=3415128 RepID=UPI003C7BB43D
MAHPKPKAQALPRDQSDALCFDPEGGLPRLLEIMRRLRDPETGCPWDVEQSFETIAPYTIEEAYEVSDAIDRQDWTELKAELGDLLLQTVYQTQIGAERDLFDFHEVANGIAQKMLDRHPHVFGTESNAKSAAQQTRDWEVQKAKERAAKAETGVLDGVALGLPALMRALKLQKRAGRVGFDWDDVDQVLAKFEEEAQELAAARESGSPAELHEEFGDLLFVAVNLGRHLDLDPEHALRDANAKFTRRFAHIQARLSEQGRSPDAASLDEMEALWQEAKAKGL